ncbi:helix-turn-helix domain-containing protein [Nodosilinea sp. FACHB-13]|uniref:helix-turn-helix domain-containing protein n=1 Tax=Nodosilinea sp. FACHB-13 TaxID=2692831 RepID=UPI001F556A5A|nr:helix-turn-helix domain-containing protein [Nodosilinea sp. FACHB-13]
MGISPRQSVIKQRVEQAKLMLSKTDLAIADIALQVGFSSHTAHQAIHGKDPQADSLAP